MPTSEWRGIFRNEEDPEYWRAATKRFPNGVPRFGSKEEATAFMLEYCQHGSNPEELQLRQSVSTLTDWKQISSMLIPKYKEYFSRWPIVPIPSNEQLTRNRFMSASADKKKGGAVYDYLLSRLHLPIHNTLNTYSTLNTLNYLFTHMRCGIFVMIRNNELAIFCPFVNKNYRNNWSDKLKLDCKDGEMETYFIEKEQKGNRRENYLPDKAQWWANGNIICNEVCKAGEEATNQWWGDQFLLQLKDMLAETCRSRIVPDCDLFLNKRDYPQLKFNKQQGVPVEPYGFIFDKDDTDPAQDVLLSDQCYARYAPILSFYSSDRFADIPFPPSEDWEAATGEVFPPSMNYSTENVEGMAKIVVGNPRDLFTSANLRKFERPWEEKQSTAFFRGTATGGGTTIETNQRLHVAQVSWEWEKEPELNGTGGNSEPYLDAKITGWNMRDKKLARHGMNYVKKENFPFNGDKGKNFVEIYKQSTYKYLLYIEGHCAACRYGFMMQLGSVIFKVASKCVADQMWYFPLLEPFKDHVPIAADLSDLQEKIAWCRAHDDDCRQIAANAQQLYKDFVSKEAILDYMQAVCVEVSRRTCVAPAWAADPPCCETSPQSSSHRGGLCSADCVACNELIAAEKEAERAAAALVAKASNQSAAERAKKKNTSDARRDRMKRKAAEEASLREKDEAEDEEGAAKRAKIE